MAAFDGYLTEEEFIVEYEKKFRRKLSKRTLRDWRARNVGPAYTRVGSKVLLSASADWLMSGIKKRRGAR